VGYVLQIWSSRHPQGFEYRQYGHSRRILEDFEGLALIIVARQSKKQRKTKRLNESNP
jgi:hypothetical protein